MLSPPGSVTCWVSYWTRNFPLRLSCIASLSAASTHYMYVNFVLSLAICLALSRAVSHCLALALYLALSLALCQLALQLPLCTPLSQISFSLIPYIPLFLVRHLCDWPALCIVLFCIQVFI